MKKANMFRGRMTVVVTLCVLICGVSIQMSKSAPSKKINIKDDTMAPFLKEGQDVVVESTSGKNWARGDVVYFQPSTAPPTVQRIVGLPGDQIEIKQGRILINDQEIIRGPLTPKKCQEEINRSLGKYPQAVHKIDCFFERSGSQRYVIFMDHIVRMDDTLEKQTLPNQSYFLVSDNRSDFGRKRYRDSRDLGPIQARFITGIVKPLEVTRDAKSAQ